MVIADLYNQLGNQMYIYCAIKSFSERANVDFILFVNEMEKKLVNDFGNQYGHDIHTIFKGIKDNISYDRGIVEAKGCIRIDYKDFFELSINDLRNNNYYVDTSHIRMKTSYFYSDILNVHNWFCFPEQIQNNAYDKIEDLRDNNKYLVSVHFRCKKDYVRGAYQLASSYWIDAAKRMLEDRRDVRFILFADTYNCFAVKRFEKRYKERCVRAGTTLAEDLCLISLCDAHIVCNSTFSVMGALLNHNSNKAKVICPSKAPCGVKYFEEDIFPDLSNWERVGNGRRSIMAFCYKMIRKIYYFIVGRKI